MNKASGEFVQKSILVHVPKKTGMRDVQKRLDNALRGYLFYPEIDWSIYAYRPPQNLAVLGAWRQSETKAFIFLLENTFDSGHYQADSAILKVVGERDEVQRALRIVAKTKTDISIKEAKADALHSIDQRAKVFHQNKPLQSFVLVLTLLSSVTSTLSIVVRRQPLPLFQNQTMEQLYMILISCIHLSSILLLFVTVMILIIVTIRYGIVLSKQL